MNPILETDELSFPYYTFDPFIYCVYHVDYYPAGNELMEPPRRGNGNDFNPRSEYRMYHGYRIPGFPQHPHRGFETITCTIEGIIDHTDSKGNSGRYGNGDLQWMTAGKGIVHGENFPLINANGPNTCRFFQIWLNLPKRSKMVEPSYVMHWNENIPVHQDEGVTVKIWAGSLYGKQALAPPPDSWAADPKNNVAIYFIRFDPKSTKPFVLPACNSETANRAIYVTQGPSIAIQISDNNYQSIPNEHYAKLVPNVDVKFKNDNDSHVDVLVLQSEPMNEPVVHHGPFVMNTKQEIAEAFMDYTQTQFGGWPWEKDAVIFPREKGRFSNKNNREEHPPKR